MFHLQSVSLKVYGRGFVFILKDNKYRKDTNIELTTNVEMATKVERTTNNEMTTHPERTTNNEMATHPERTTNTVPTEIAKEYTVQH